MPPIPTVLVSVPRRSACSVCLSLAEGRKGRERDKGTWTTPALSSSTPISLGGLPSPGSPAGPARPGATEIQNSENRKKKWKVRKVIKKYSKIAHHFKYILVVSFYLSQWRWSLNAGTNESAKNVKSIKIAKKAKKRMTSLIWLRGLYKQCFYILLGLIPHKQHLDPLPQNSFSYPTSGSPQNPRWPCPELKF